MRNSLRVLAVIAAPLLGSVGAEAATILMPAGSTVWMKMNSSILAQHGGSCWDGATAGADDCIASNQSGPGNGIPTTTFGSGQGTVTTSAEVLPDQIRGYLKGRSSQLTISLQDTYTVHGTLPDAFDLSVELNAEGTMHALDLGVVNSPGRYQLFANVQAEIGTFNPESVDDINENLRVTAFTEPAATQNFSRFNLFSASPFSQSFDITASHARSNVRVGDSFTLAFGILSFVTLGEIDMLNTGRISFNLPDGVFLTSALGGRFGDAAVPSEVPLPAALPLFAGGLGVLAFLARRRKQKAEALA